MKFMVWAGVLISAGCSTVDTGDYQPKTSRERMAYERAARDISPENVRTNFNALARTEVVWAGIIRDIEFKEKERTVLVAFNIEHRNFDWKDHGGGTPYHLSAEGEGMISAGWAVDKPTSITRLKYLAKPGYMILVYGKPYQITDESIQLSATAVRPVSVNEYKILEPLTEALPNSQPKNPDQNL